MTMPFVFSLSAVQENLYFIDPWAVINLCNGNSTIKTAELFV